MATYFFLAAKLWRCLQNDGCSLVQHGPLSVRQTKNMLFFLSNFSVFSDFLEIPKDSWRTRKCRSESFGISQKSFQTKKLER